MLYGPSFKILPPERTLQRGAFLAAAGNRRVVAANDYDATTRSMRDLAAEARGDPAAFTRLAMSLGYLGEELRAVLTEARQRSQCTSFSGRANGRRHGSNSDVALITAKLEAEATLLPYISAASVASAAKVVHGARRVWTCGFRSCRSVADLLNHELRLFRPDEVQLVGSSGPQDLDLGAICVSEAVVVIGFGSCSRASVLSALVSHGATLMAIADSAAAPMEARLYATSQYVSQKG